MICYLLYRLTTMAKYMWVCIHIGAEKRKICKFSSIEGTVSVGEKSNKDFETVLKIIAFGVIGN